MTPEARVLQFPPSGAARPQEYGQFTRELSPDELAGCFCFSDDDQRQIARRRGDAEPMNRLFAHRTEEDPDSKECPECTSAIPVKARRCPQCTAQLGG